MFVKKIDTPREALIGVFLPDRVRSALVLHPKQERTSKKQRDKTKQKTC
jgi:hypothetical protein